MFKVVRNSLIRAVMDTLQPRFPGVQYYEWDAHAEPMDLPKTDLIGLVNFSCQANGGFHDLDFSVAMMTIDDPSLGRMVDYVDLLYARFQPQERFSILLPDGTDAGFEALIFDGTNASPMGRVDTRPTSEISVSGRVGRAGLLP